MNNQMFENEYEQSKDYANKIISTADETQEIFKLNIQLYVKKSKHMQLLL